MSRRLVWDLSETGCRFWTFSPLHSTLRRFIGIQAKFPPIMQFVLPISMWHCFMPSIRSCWYISFISHVFPCIPMYSHVDWTTLSYGWCFHLWRWPSCQCWTRIWSWWRSFVAWNQILESEPEKKPLTFAVSRCLTCKFTFPPAFLGDVVWNVRWFWEIVVFYCVLRIVHWF